MFFSQRVPGWTDRIFYKGLKSIAYSWIEDIMSSDHRPVYGYFYFETNFDEAAPGDGAEFGRHAVKNLIISEHLQQFRSRSPSQSIEAFKKSQDLPFNSLETPHTKSLAPSVSISIVPSRPPPPLPASHEDLNPLIDLSIQSSV
jgi:hypothetical protein